MLPVARQFAPDFVLVSAGFDAHVGDPLAMMTLDAAAFASMTDAMVGLADECCDGDLVLLLEGGYDLVALRESVAAVLQRLAEPDHGVGHRRERGGVERHHRERVAHVRVEAGRYQDEVRRELARDRKHDVSKRRAPPQAIQPRIGRIYRAARAGTGAHLVALPVPG